MNEDLKDAAKLAVQMFNRKPRLNRLIAAVLAFGCFEQAISDETNARIALEQHNFSDIQPLGPDFFNCSNNEIFGTRARARTQEGSTINVVVCRAPSHLARIKVLAGPRS